MECFVSEQRTHTTDVEEFILGQEGAQDTYQLGLIPHIIPTPLSNSQDDDDNSALTAKIAKINQALNFKKKG